MKPERLDSLDVFRGLTVAGMILVNNAGDWAKVHAPLGHAEWHGWTVTDLIFPFFLFIVGVAITFSFSHRPPARRAILRRAALLFALGLLLNAFPFVGVDRPLRVPGVLQRIALCYLAAALVAARTTWRTQALVAGGLLVFHAAALRFAPGFDLTKGGDVGSWLDWLLLRGHLHQAKPDYALFDPEGLFSTLPAIATTLTGVLAGRWLRETTRAAHERASGLFFAGFVGAALGLACDALVPINKNLWTSSYVLLSSGLACSTLAACWWLVDLQGVRAWATPFLAFGRNPIVAFWASHALARLLVFGVAWQSAPGVSTNAKQWLYETVFARGASTAWTSLAYAATYVVVWWALMAVMDRKKLYVKV